MTVEQQRAVAMAAARARSAASNAPADQRDNILGKIDAAVRGAADTLTFGLADEMSAGADALLNPLIGTGADGGSIGERYSRNLEKQRAIDAADAEKRGTYRLTGQLAGGITGGVGLAKAGLSLGARAAEAGSGLGRVAVGSAADGAITGALQGAGSGQGASGRLEGATYGAGMGLAVGAAAPFAVAGASKILQPVVAPVMSRLRPDNYANGAISEGLRRSGSSVEDVTSALIAAERDGQGVFNVADALGNSGQRMLSTVARNPSDARQGVVEALIGRQMDQGGRVANALQDASGSPLTAAQYEAMLTAQRATAANRNYAPVRTDQAAIDVSAPVALANRSISPAADNLANARQAVPTDLAARSGIEASEAQIRDPIRQAVREARSYLASDGLTVTNVEKAFRAKTNIDQMIADATEKGRGALVSELMPIRNSLDDALAATSRDYAAARDAYRTASQPIEAIQTGRDMARPRTRAQDNLSTYGALPDDASRRAATIGYFDPLIARAEGTAGKMTNAARPLITGRTAQEFPVFAAPGEADRLGSRLAREQRMFETNAAALGGSKTADNLADAADMSRFDPSIMSNLMRGRIVDAMIQAGTRGLNEASGMSKPVIERIAKVLMETDPSAAAQMLTAARDRTVTDQGRRAIVNSIMTNLGAVGSGRLVAP